MSESTPPPEELLAHVPFVRGLARILVAHEHDAEDIAQDAIAAALERPDAARSGLRPWLSGVTRNLVRRTWRRRSRRRTREAAVARPEAVEPPDEVVAKLEISRRVVEAVRSLEDPYRRTVVSRFYDDRTPAEIALREGVPAATVRTRLRRGLQQVRARLDADHGGDRRACSLALLALVPSKRALAPSAPEHRGRTMKVAGVVLASIVAGLLVVLAVTTGESDPQPDDTPPRVAERREVEIHDATESDGEAGSGEGEEVPAGEPEKASPSRRLFVGPGHTVRQIPEPPPPLHFAVVAPDGSPIPSASVFVIQFDNLSSGGGDGGRVVNGRAEVRMSGGSGTDEDKSRLKTYFEIRGATDANGSPLPYGPILFGPLDGPALGLVVKLPPERHLGGVVLSPDGRPVAGATVWAQPTYPELRDYHPRPWRPGHGEAVTDGAGRFHLGRLADRPYRLHAVPPDGGVEPDPVPARHGADDVEIRLPATPPLAIRVVDEAGRPVAGARAMVRLARPPATGRPPAPLSVATNEKGEATLPGLVVGRRYVFEIAPPAGRADIRKLRLFPWSAGAGTFTLPRARTLEVLALDPDGKAVPGATVQWRCEHAGGRARTDGDGRAMLTGVPDEEVELRAYAPGVSHRAPGVRPVAVRADLDRVTVTIRPTVVLEVVVVNWPEEAVFAPVAIAPRGTPPESRNWSIMSMDSGRARIEGLEAKREYTLLVGPYARMGQLRPADTALIESAVGGGSPIEVTLTPGARISGRLHLAEGLARPTVLARAYGVFFGSAIEDDGTYVVWGMPPGTYDVEATAYRGEERVRVTVRARTGETTDIRLE